AGRVSYRVQEGIGSAKAPAPQATLMSLVVKGILTRKLPWALVLIGVFTALLMGVIGVPALAFAVGMYLPLESTAPLFIGRRRRPSPSAGPSARSGTGSGGASRSPTRGPASSTAPGSWPGARSWGWPRPS